MMATAQQIIDHLDEISRRRPLTMSESLQLERAITKNCGSSRRLWRAEEDEIARSLRSAGTHYKVIAAQVARSSHAVAARLRYLRQLSEAR